MKCFYHAADFDGKCSAAIVVREHKECVPIGIDYGDLFPMDLAKGDDVFMVDFCLQKTNGTTMAELCSEAKSLTWIDHHKTSLEQADLLRKMGAYVIVEAGDKAACELTWLTLFGEPVPMAVRLLSCYDTGGLNGEDKLEALAFQYYMKSIDTPLGASSIWDVLLEDDDLAKRFIRECIKKGATVLQYQLRQDERAVRRGRQHIRIEGHTAIAVNGYVSPAYSVDDLDVDLLITYERRQGRKWVVTIRAVDEGVDASEIAKLYGGGGHKKAAGFTCSELPFEI